MPLIKNGVYVDDCFVTVADDADLPANGTIVSLARFGRERDALLARNAPLGVRLRSDESPESLGEDVQRLSVIVVEFPKFRDGRGFSWARMLRTRLHFEGEIRATGDFLYDQVAYLARVGFDAFEVGDRLAPADITRALDEMTDVYQPSADGRRTICDLRAHA
jgi:uncharacterized protein (DUF934 family)